MPRRTLSLGNDSSSFTQKRKEESQRSDGKRTNLFDQDFLLFMSRLHEHYKNKKSGLPPRKSPESITLNISDSFFLPTISTSDLIDDSEHSYIGACEEQDKACRHDPNMIHFTSNRKKSLIPVRSPNRPFDTNVPRMRDKTLPCNSNLKRQKSGGASTISSEVMSNSVAPVVHHKKKKEGKMSSSTRTTAVQVQSSTSTRAIQVHNSAADDDDPCFSTILNQQQDDKWIKGQEPMDCWISNQQEDKHALFLNSLITRAIVDASTYTSDSGDGRQATSVLHSDKLTENQLKLNQAFETKTQDHNTTITEKSNTASLSQLQKTEINDTSLKCRGERSLNMAAVHNAISNMKQSLSSIPSLQNCYQEQNAMKYLHNIVKDRQVNKEKTALSTTDNSTQQISGTLATNNIFTSTYMEIENKKHPRTEDSLDPNKKTGKDPSHRRRQLLGRRSMSWIPVMKRNDSCVRLVKNAKENLLTTAISMKPSVSGSSFDSIVRGNKEIYMENSNIFSSKDPLHEVRTEHAMLRSLKIHNEYSVDVPVAEVAKSEQLRANKPPLPRQKLRSNMSHVKPQKMQLPKKPVLSTKISPPRVQFTTKIRSKPPVSSGISEKKQWIKQSPHTITALKKKSVSPKEQLYKAHIKHKDEDDFDDESRSYNSSPMLSTQSSTSQSNTRLAETTIRTQRTTYKSFNVALPLCHKKTQHPNIKTRRSQSQPADLLEHTNKEDLPKEQIKIVHIGQERHRKTEASLHSSVKACKHRQKSAATEGDHLKVSQESWLSRQQKTVQSPNKKRTNNSDRHTIEGNSQDNLLQNLTNQPTEYFTKHRQFRNQIDKTSTKNSGDNRENCQRSHRQIASISPKLKSKFSDNNPEKKIEWKQMATQTKDIYEPFHEIKLKQHMDEFDKSRKQIDSQYYVKDDHYTRKSRKDETIFPNSYDYNGSIDKHIQDTMGRTDTIDCEGKMFHLQEHNLRFLEGRTDEQEYDTNISEAICKGVSWSASESNVLILSSRCRSDRKDLCVLTTDNMGARVAKSVRNSKRARWRSCIPVLKDRKTRKITKEIAEPGRLETNIHLSSTVKIPQHVKPMGDNNIDWSLIDQDASKKLTVQEISRNSPNGTASLILDKDVDKQIQADMEEVLVQIYQIQSRLMVHVDNLQDRIAQLQLGLSDIQPPLKTTDIEDTQWEGTLQDYLMLLGFMIMQICVQYFLLK